MTAILIALIIALLVMCALQASTINELSVRLHNSWQKYNNFDIEWGGKVLTANATDYVAATHKHVMGLHDFWKDVHSHRLCEEFLYEAAKIKYSRDRAGIVYEMWNTPDNPADSWFIALNGREMAGVEYYLYHGLFARGNLTALEDAILLTRIQQPAEEIEATTSSVNAQQSKGRALRNRYTLAKALSVKIYGDDDDDTGFFTQI